MKQATRFSIDPGWALMIRDMGINPTDVLRLSGLPDALFDNLESTLSVADYFSLWTGLEKAAGPELPLKIGEAISPEAFSPPIFSYLCSQDMNTGLQRLQHFKRLVGPLILNLDINAHATKIDFECYEYSGHIPDVIMAMELVFFTKMARLATREHIEPLSITWTREFQPLEKYVEFFGVKPEIGARTQIEFSANDAIKPFLTQNPSMWSFFEPELQKKLSAIDQSATFTEKVKNVLLEMLPAGETAAEAVASRLAVSKRTLQRRLNDESTNFQNLLNSTREELAKHYLKNSQMSPAEISFLLGFQDSNSFFRAFNNWTGKTPEQVRQLN